MTTNNNEEFDNDGESAIMPAGARITFARKNDLVKVVRQIEKNKSVDKALEFLESVMLDDKADLKLRVDCAKYVVDKKQSLSESISKDQLSRAIAESRLLLTQQVTSNKRIRDVSEEGDDYSTPRYCPEIILDHSSIKSM